MTKATIGFAMCGSFCTFSKAFEQVRALVSEGIDVIPIMSENARSTDTRFGTAAEMVKTAEEITGKKVLSTSVETEPIRARRFRAEHRQTAQHKEHLLRSALAGRSRKQAEFAGG